MRQRANVKWYDYINGYGMTTNQVFIHHKELNEMKKGRYLQLEEGDLIEFEAVPIVERNVMKATNVELIQSA